jgi:hypothetical protein
VAANQGYHPCREPQSLGPKVFSLRICSAAFPPRYHPPVNIMKYAVETNPSLWLKDYRLDTDSDYFIIYNLPLFLADSARMWLEHLPSDWIHNWSDLKEIIMGNFQGPTSAPETHGISRTTGRSRERLSASTSGASLGSATHCPTSPTMTLSGCSYLGPPVSPCSISWDARAREPLRNSLTSQ